MAEQGGSYFISVLVLSLVGLFFPFFVCPDLGLYGLPIDHDVLRVLLESWIGFLWASCFSFSLFFTCVYAVKLSLQVPLSISYNSIDVSLVLDSDCQSAIPLVKFDVELDSSIEEPGREQDLLCFLVLFAV